MVFSLVKVCKPDAGKGAGLSAHCKDAKRMKKSRNILHPIAVLLRINCPHKNHHKLHAQEPIKLFWSKV